MTSIDANDMLRIHTGERSYPSWAIQVPNPVRRRAMTAPDGLQGEGGRVPSMDVTSALAGRTHADFVAEQLRERWAARRSDGRFEPEGAAHVSWSLAGVGPVVGTLVFLMWAIVAA